MPVATCRPCPSGDVPVSLDLQTRLLLPHVEPEQELRLEEVRHRRGGAIDHRRLRHGLSGPAPVGKSRAVGVVGPGEVHPAACHHGRDAPVLSGWDARPRCRARTPPRACSPVRRCICRRRHGHALDLAAELVGSQALMVRQSSQPLARPLGIVGCAHMVPNFVASRTSLHGVSGCGGRQRSAPTGGAAKGIPLNAAMPSCIAPWSGPSVVWTMSVGSAAVLVESPSKSTATASDSRPAFTCDMPVLPSRFPGRRLAVFGGVS